MDRQVNKFVYMTINHGNSMCKDSSISGIMFLFYINTKELSPKSVFALCHFHLPLSLTLVRSFIHLVSFRLIHQLRRSFIIFIASK